MRPSSIFSFDTLSLRDPGRLKAWALVLLSVLLLEGALRAGVSRYMPRPVKWGNGHVQRVMDQTDWNARDGKPLDVVIFGSSQGYTWIDEADLDARGINTINSSVPGGNMAVSELLASKFLFREEVPRLVVIAVGPMSLAHWNEHFANLIRQSPLGSAYLGEKTGSLWLQRNVHLFRYGGQRVNQEFIKHWRNFLRKSPTKANGRVTNSEAMNTSRRLASIRGLERSDAQIAAFKNLVTEVESKGATTAVINMPVHPDAKREGAWPYSEYSREVRAIAGARPFLDLDALAHPDYFGDYVHPSKRGIASVRDSVATFLQQCLATHPARPARPGKS